MILSTLLRFVFNNILQMNITYDFTLYKTPCSILSVDSVDILGTHKISLDKSAVKIRLEPNTQREMGQQEEVS